MCRVAELEAARTDVAGLEHRRRRGARDRAHGRGASLEGLGRLQERKSDDGNRLHMALRTQGKAEAEAACLQVQRCKLARASGEQQSGRKRVVTQARAGSAC